MSTMLQEFDKLDPIEYELVTDYLLGGDMLRIDISYFYNVGAWFNGLRGLSPNRRLNKQALKPT